MVKRKLQTLITPFNFVKKVQIEKEAWYSFKLIYVNIHRKRHDLTGLTCFRISQNNVISSRRMPELRLKPVKS